MTVPNTASILSNQNMFIRDWDAFTHSTQHGQVLVNVQKGKENDSVMVGSGNLTKASVFSNLLGTICNRHSEILRKGIMQDVTHCPSMQCNVFSLTKLMSGSWELGDDDLLIWLVKERREIALDIKLITKRGVIFVFILNVR